MSGPAFLHTLETAQRDRPGVNPNYFELTQLVGRAGHMGLLRRLGLPGGRGAAWG